MAKSLNRRRMEALAAIGVAAASTGASSGAPTPTLEAPKQLAIAAGDIALCIVITKIYFDHTPSEEEMVDLLTEYGVIVAVGGVLAYGGVKATEALLGEVLNFIPLAGWAISATITASVTATVGLAWLLLCDNLVAEGRTVLASATS